jgi:DNA-binding NtrC family response regulator
MREVFRRLELAAVSDATVLLEGETGTGKEGAAVGIHETSARADGPLVVVDCGAIPANLIESELFGHEPGAFTGAGGRRIGAFEEASGGTLFLDEIGELAPALQPTLLRALESRTIKRVGASKPIACDVRVVAATNRDLRAEVNDGQFRADLYYRLAVVRVNLPPLRERTGDLPLLVDHLLERLGVGPDDRASLSSDEFLAGLERANWLGNVRELRNHLEQCLVLQTTELPEPAPDSPEAGSVDLSRPYDEVRRLAIAGFERAYVAALLDAHGGDVSAAARAAGINRAYLYRLIKRHR